MKYGRYGWPYFFIRVGLGITLLWIGFDMIRNPDTWIGYMPAVIPGGLSREAALKLAAVFDIALGGLLISKLYPKITGLLASGHLLGILLMQGIDAVLIRDVGLLGSALALLFWPQNYHKRKLIKMPQLRRKKRDFDD